MHGAKQLAAHGMVLLALAIPCSTAHAARPPPPLKAIGIPAPFTTRGAWLETNLGAMLGGCGVPMPMRQAWALWDDGEISAVPDDLRSKVAINSQIYVLADKDLTRLFGTVWSGKDLLNAKRDSYLNLDYGNTRDQVTLPGITASQYSNSCASVVSAAFKAAGDLSAGVATLKAVLDSSYKVDRSNRVDLVTGTFSSPVVAAWKGEMTGVSISTQNFVAALLYWQWYENNGRKMGGPAYILEEFVGDALYQIYSSDVSSGADVKADFKLQALGAGVEAQTEARLTVERRLSGQVYQVAVERSGTSLSAQLVAMPGLEEVARKASATKLQVTSADRTPILIAGAERSIIAKIPNFPRAYCEAGLWSASPILSNAEALDPAGAALGSRLATCQLTFRYLTIAQDVANGARVTPSISRSLDQGGKRVDLTLSADPVLIPGASVNVSRTGVVQKAELTQISDNQVKLSWTTTWRLNANPSVGDSTIAVTRANLQCADEFGVNAPVAEIGPLAGLNPKTFTIVWSSQASGKFADFTALTSQATCKISADIVIRAGATNVPQTLEEIVVLYPTAAKP